MKVALPCGHTAEVDHFMGDRLVRCACPPIDVDGEKRQRNQWIVAAEPATAVMHTARPFRHPAPPDPAVMATLPNGYLS